MAIVIQFGAALALLLAVAYLSHRRGYTTGFVDGLTDGRKEASGLARAEGYSQGVYEGRLKAQLEQETFQYKAQRDYDTGYNDALAAVAGMNYTAMLDEATTKLSA